MTTKACMSCGEVKPLGEYSPHPQTTDGRAGQCKACKAAYSRAYYWQHRERIREKWKEASRDPDVAERKREQNRRYREKKRVEREQDPEWQAKKAERENKRRINAAKREDSTLRRQERETQYMLKRMARAEQRRQRQEDLRNQVLGKRLRREKACTKCGVVKPLTEFHPDFRRIDGRCSGCKTCKNRQSMEARDRRGGERRAKRAEQKKEQSRRKRQQSLARQAELRRKRLARSARIEAATYRRMEREAETLQRQLVEGEKRRQRRLKKEREGRTPIIPTTKTCARCGQEKPKTEFYRRQDTTDGHQSACKPCHNALSAASRETRRAKTEKTCRVCGVVKPMTDYTKDKQRTDGRASTCRECVADVKAKKLSEEAAAAPSKKPHECQYAQCHAPAAYRFDGDDMWRYCSIHVHVVQKAFDVDPKTYEPKKKKETMSTDLIITTARRLRGAATEAQQHAAKLKKRGEAPEKILRLEGEANGLQIAAGALEQAAREAKQKDVA